MVWCWRLRREHGTWKKFDAGGEQAVERAFQMGHPTVQSTFFNPRSQQHVVYNYDLNKLQQVPLPARLEASHTGVRRATPRSVSRLIPCR